MNRHARTSRALLKGTATNLTILCGATLLGLLLLELLFQIIARTAPQQATKVREHRICDGCSYLYEPIPLVGEHNELGLRGPAPSPNKPPGVVRIALVGDSVTYGSGVEADQVLSAALQRRFDQSGHRVEIVNAGVRGFTTYNEVRWLRDRILALEPDLVVLQTCMNDIANPAWHWNKKSSVELVPPVEAFPDPAQRTIPVPEWSFLSSPLSYSMLFTTGYMIYLKGQQRTLEIDIGVTQNGRFWPTYITAEADSTLLPLTDYTSQEWGWLRAQLDLAHSVSASRGIPLLLLVVPLAYELEAGYPLQPEAGFMRYCNEKGLRCLNLRETFKGRRADELFIMNSGKHLPTLPDVWHLSPAGHAAAADALYELLVPEVRGLVGGNGDSNP